MFSFLKNTPWFRILAGLACACGTAAARDFALQVADPNPLGIGNFVPSDLDLATDAGVEGGMKGAFLYGVGLQTDYDSNFFLSEDDEEDEVSFLFQPWLSYTTDPEGGASFVLNANYQPTYNAFLNNSDFNELDHSADVSLSWIGGRTEASVFASYRELSGTDRLSGGFTSGSLFSGGVRASRQIAPRTSLNGGLSYSQSDYSSGNSQGTNIFTGSFGGLWSATERTDIGSSIRYSQTESDNTGTRDAWALLAELRYRAGERVWLSASLGPEFTSDSESGGNDVGVRAALDARYIINERWTWVNSLGTDTVASPSDTGYLVNNVGFSTGLQHQLLRGSINGGVMFDYSDYQQVGDVLTERENEENLSLYLGYSRNLFAERVSFNSSVRYRVNNGDRDWSQWLVSMGLSVTF
ncbi:MAG: hypothetical protein EHM17_02085 [Verrucomicrobiaceae bacterium]|nr:MAG: hypothetical protein EHM17_02085 [Verrucomicrobiaceae bacterium]